MSLECPITWCLPAPSLGPQERPRHRLELDSRAEGKRRDSRPLLRAVSVKARGAAARRRHRRLARRHLPQPAVAAVPVSSGDSSTCKTPRTIRVQAEPGDSVLLEPRNLVCAQEMVTLNPRRGGQTVKRHIQEDRGFTPRRVLTFPQDLSPPCPISIPGAPPSPAALRNADGCKAGGVGVGVCREKVTSVQFSERSFHGAACFIPRTSTSKHTR